MKTSCYKSYKGNQGIGISLSSPNSWNGPMYNALAPSWNLLYSIKSGLIDQTEYEKTYKEEVLEKLDPAKIYDELKDNVLLCWEMPEEFCHRRIVAQWLETALNISVPEWNKDDNKIHSKKLW